MNTQPHKITVVTVCYNAAQFIEKTLQSVVNQTYPDMEYIVIDGGSTDGTVDIIRKYSDRITYLVSEPDGGIYQAMNKAVKHATGDYVNFMNAGDVFFDNRVLEEVFAGKRYDEDVIYGSNLIHFSGGYKRFHPFKVDVIDHAMPFCHQSSFTRTSLLKERPFNTEFRRLADYVFFRKLYEDGGSFRRVSKYISIYDAYGVSTEMTLDAYAENCRARHWKPTVKDFLRLWVWTKYRRMRYCKLRFLISDRLKPQKYSLTRDRFHPLED